MKDEQDFEDVLRSAKAGDEQAIACILKMVEPIVEKNSRINGKKDEDLYQINLLKILDLIDKFQV